MADLSTFFVVLLIVSGVVLGGVISGYAFFRLGRRERDIGEERVQARRKRGEDALAQKLTGPVKSRGTVLIFTNQIRQKIGIMFGNPETTSGGMAFKFYASVRLDIRRMQSIKEGPAVVGNRAEVTVRKNKVAPPFRTAEFDIMYNQGINAAGDILDLADQYDLVERRGSYYHLEGELLGQGRMAAISSLANQPEQLAHLRGLIRIKAGLASEDSATIEEAA